MKDIYFFKRLIQGIFLLEDENAQEKLKKIGTETRREGKIHGKRFTKEWKEERSDWKSKWVACIRLYLMVLCMRIMNRIH